MGVAILHECKFADIAACDPPLDECCTEVLSHLLLILV